MTVIPLDDHRNLDKQLAEMLAKSTVSNVRAFHKGTTPREPLPTIVAGIAAALRTLDKEDVAGLELAVLAALAQDFTPIQIGTAIRAHRENRP